uniref:ST3 beta-galactoside alpha-2,3-sialyltransferase 4 n=1 Tax=Oryzias melastigma TaxID=30732 RepID=A0A3B3BHQ8_ORYME
MSTHCSKCTFVTSKLQNIVPSSPATDWRPVQGVPCLRPSVAGIGSENGWMDGCPIYPHILIQMIQEIVRISAHAEIRVKTTRIYLKPNSAAGLVSAFPVALFGGLLPRNLNMPTSFFPFPHSLKCKMCVVVGNSFAIKKTSLGSAINKYDVVIRLNNAPVPGYEEDVGNKTTMRIFYPESAISNPRLHNDEDTLMVMVPFKPHDLRWLKEMLYDEKRDRRGFWKPPPLIWLVNRSNVRVLDPHFMHQTVKQMKPFQPTTGFLAVFVALNYCDVVHIAGFGYPPKSDQQQPIHYFENNTMKAMKATSKEKFMRKRIEFLASTTRTLVIAL